MSDRELVTIDPATLKELGRVPIFTNEEIKRKLALAREAFSKKWSGLDFDSRSEHLLQLLNLIEERKEALTRLISMEVGKPLRESEREVMNALNIVLPDADLDFAARAVVWGSNVNAGQFCASVERVYVHSEIMEPFTERVVGLVKKLRVGNGMDPDVDMGPQVSRSQLNIVIRQVEGAVMDGARVLTGGGVYDSGPLSEDFFYRPTVLVDVTHDMEVMREETFGPVTPIISFDSIDEAVTLSNDCRYGLGASMFTRDEALADSIASRLDAGMVWINEPLFAAPAHPWVVRKDSGMGFELGRLGILEFMKPRYTNSQYINSDKPRAWWYPY